MNRKTLVLVLALAIVVGATSASAQTSYTIDLSRSSQSAFKLFGEVASTRPIGTADITIEKGSWSAEIIAVRGLGDQNEGEQADYYDGFITRSWESGSFSGTAAVEIFHAPAQLGNESSTFIAPLATVTWKHGEHFSVETGAQYVGTYNTDYGGDRVYGWVQPTFSTSWRRLSLDVSPGYIAADTGRSTVYVSGDLTFDFNDHIGVYVSYLEAKSWDVVGVSGMVPIDGTYTVGISVDFNKPY